MRHVARMALFIAGVGVCVVVYLFLNGFLPRDSRGTFLGVLPALILALGVFTLNAVFFWWDGSSVRSLGAGGIRRELSRLGVGFLGGSALVMGWLLIVAAVTRSQWQLNPDFRLGSVVPIVAFCFFNNAAEELAYRGYLLVRLQQLFGSPPAILGTSAVFALSHVQAGVPWSGAVGVVFTCGIIFAVIFLRWRSLPMALGFHVATNVLQELFGLRLSAMSLIKPDVTEAVAAKQSLTILGLIAVLNVAVALSLARRTPIDVPE
jgi:membrane protease YdiL (CAAX protease family)